MYLHRYDRSGTGIGPTLVPSVVTVQGRPR